MGPLFLAHTHHLDAGTLATAAAAAAAAAGPHKAAAPAVITTTVAAGAVPPPVAITAPTVVAPPHPATVTAPPVVGPHAAVTTAPVLQAVTAPTNTSSSMAVIAAMPGSGSAIPTNVTSASTQHSVTRTTSVTAASALASIALSTGPRPITSTSVTDTAGMSGVDNLVEAAASHEDEPFGSQPRHYLVADFGDADSATAKTWQDAKAAPEEAKIARAELWQYERARQQLFDMVLTPRKRFAINKITEIVTAETQQAYDDAKQSSSSAQPSPFCRSYKQLGLYLQIMHTPSELTSMAHLVHENSNLIETMIDKQPPLHTSSMTMPVATADKEPCLHYHLTNDTSEARESFLSSISLLEKAMPFSKDVLQTHIQQAYGHVRGKAGKDQSEPVFLGHTISSSREAYACLIAASSEQRACMYDKSTVNREEEIDTLNADHLAQWSVFTPSIGVEGITDKTIAADVIEIARLSQRAIMKHRTRRHHELLCDDVFTQPISGFGIKSPQLYVKSGITVTMGHDEIGDASAGNYMLLESIGCALWIGFGMHTLKQTMPVNDIYELLMPKKASEKPISTMEIGNILDTLIKKGCDLEVVFQIPGTTVFTPPGNGAAHLVITLASYATHVAWNMSFTLGGISKSLDFWRGEEREFGNFNTNNSTLATPAVLPVFTMQRRGYELTGIQDQMQRFDDTIKEIEQRVAPHLITISIEPGNSVCEDCGWCQDWKLINDMCVHCVVDVYDKVKDTPESKTPAILFRRLFPTYTGEEGEAPIDLPIATTSTSSSTAPTKVPRRQKRKRGATKFSDKKKKKQK
jgi:hypothetical protein